MNKHGSDVCRLILLIFFSIFVFISNASAQNITKKIRVVSGGLVAFNFNSITEYSIGKSLNGWTRLFVQFADTTNSGNDGASTGWVVKVKADFASIQSDGAGPDLALSSIEIKPTTIIAGSTSFNITLTDSFQTIVSGPDPGVSTTTGEIIVNFDCGKSTPLLGKMPDYYFVDLIFIIEEVP